MAATWATARCPSCGAPLAALLPLSPGARWFSCPHCHASVPLVPPMNPPPIFSWEVFPQVYPPLPPLRVLTRPVGRLATVALVACVVLLAGLAGALGYDGWQALGPSSFRLSGSVASAADHRPVVGALVTVQSESGWSEQVVTDGAGGFSFSGIPSGGATLNVTSFGFAPLTVELFFSSEYRATGAGPNGLRVFLSPGPSTNATTVYESPFPTLESFVASLWSAGVILAIAALVAGGGAWMAFRERRPTVGVAGGLAAATAPVGMNILGVTSAFPLVSFPAAAAIGLGLVAALLELLPVVWAGRAADTV